MVCRNCGKELPEDANFCSFCGVACNAVPDTAQGAVQETVDAAQGAVQETADAAQGAVQETVDAAQGAMQETVDAAQGAVQETADAAQGAVQETADAAQETAGTVRTESAAAKSEAAAVVKRAAEASRDAIMSGVNGVKDQMAKASDNTKKMLYFVMLGIVIAVCLLIVLCTSLASSPKKAFNAYVQGEFTCDYKKVINNSIAAKKAQKALDVYDEDDYEDEYEDLKDYYEDQKEDWEDDDIKYKVKIDIKDVEKIKKSNKEFKWAQELMEDYYDCDADKVQQFAIVEARIKAEYYEDGDRDKDYDRDTSRTQYLLVKLEGTWYMTTFSHDDIKDYLKDHYK